MRKLLFLALTFFSCNQTQIGQNKNAIQDKVSQRKSNKIVNHDTFFELLEKAIKSDSFEYDNWEPFIFFKSGNFLRKTVKNIVIVHCPTDTTYCIELYVVKENNWFQSDSLSGLRAFPVQFNLVFDDYNFDGLNDIYIQVSVSNGHSLSYGHLLTIDPKTLKFTKQIETDELANMQPDIKTKTIISEEAIWCKTNGKKELCKWTNKWVHGQLITIKKDCPCEPE